MDNKNVKESEVFVWSIPKFSEVTEAELQSEEFHYNGNICTRIDVHPQGYKETVGFISIYLMNKTDRDIDEIFFSLTIETHLKDRKSFVLEKRGEFESDCGLGNCNFLTLEKLNDPYNGYLVGDTLKIKVHIEDTSVTTLGKRLWDLREDEESADVSIKTSTESLPAHMLVLNAISPVMRAMLISGMKESKTKCVEMKEFTTIAVNQFLEFVYTDKVPSHDSKRLCVAQLWAMGDKYIVPEMTKYVEESKESLITKGNVIANFIDSHMYGTALVKEMCIGFMAKNLKELEVEIGKLPDRVQASILRELIKHGVSSVAPA